MVLALVLLSLLSKANIFVAAADSLLPLQKNQYAFPRGNLSSPVIVDFFIDLGCSSCLSSWPTITEVYDTYKDRVKFQYRVFPLPYHQQSFILAKAAQVVDYYGVKGSVFTFFDTSFANQPLIYNTATADSTYNEVVALVSEWATAGTGVSYNDYYVGMNNTANTIGNTLEMNARYMWKNACLKEAYATPLFAVNGLGVDGLDTFADWQSVLDPLLAQ